MRLRLLSKLFRIRRGWILSMKKTLKVKKKKPAMTREQIARLIAWLEKELKS